MPCGVLAIGRCSECGSAFCGSHQAIQRDDYTWSRYTDWCLSCQQRDQQHARAAAEESARIRSTQLAESARRRQEAWNEILRRGFERFARQRTYFVPAVERHYFITIRKKARREPCGLAVPIGQVHWSRNVDSEDQTDRTCEAGLDQSGNIVDMQSSIEFSPSHDRIREQDLDGLIATRLEELLGG